MDIATRNRQPDGRREELFQTAIAEFSPLLDRIAFGYELDPDKRRDLRQDIHLRLWMSLQLFDGRCSLRTWTLRVAHNAAVSHVSRESRRSARFVSLEDLETRVSASPGPIDPAGIDRQRALEHLRALIHDLKPLDRQVLLSWLEDLDASAISEITGLSPAHVAVKIHRIMNLLARRYRKENPPCPSRQRPIP